MVHTPMAMAEPLPINSTEPRAAGKKEKFCGCAQIIGLIALGMAAVIVYLFIILFTQVSTLQHQVAQQRAEIENLTAALDQDSTKFEGQLSVLRQPDSMTWCDCYFDETGKDDDDRDTTCVPVQCNPGFFAVALSVTTMNHGGGGWEVCPKDFCDSPGVIKCCRPCLLVSRVRAC